MHGLLLERLDGPDLHELFQRRFKGGRLELRNLKTILRQVLTALAFLHDHDLIHKDLKVR